MRPGLRNGSRLFRIAAAVLVAAALAAVGAVIARSQAGDGAGQPAADRPAQTPPVRTAFRGATIPRGKTAPDFVLRTENGDPVRLSQERGKLVLLAFLYTRCTDVCPLIASKLDSIVRGLGREADSVRILTVSVDPVGDTPRAVRDYMRAHRLGPQFRWLLGTRTQLWPVWRKYNVAVSPTQSSELVAHAAPVLLLDRRGRPRVYYQEPQSRNAIEHDVRLLLRPGR
jgi:protein SCO1/2